MKVFISWSGPVSLKLAQILRDWLPYVVSNVEPFVSAEDIEKGTRPMAIITAELEQSAFGILCVTRDNMLEPWIHFEAGALSKTVKESSRVCPLLFGLRVGDLGPSNPLFHFQATTFERDDVLRMLKTLGVAVYGSEPRTLEKLFDKFWPELQTSANTALRAAGQQTETRDISNTEKLLEELLSIVRSQAEALPEAVAARLRPATKVAPKTYRWAPMNGAPETDIRPLHDLSTKLVSDQVLQAAITLLEAQGRHIDLHIGGDKEKHIRWRGGPSERALLRELVAMLGPQHPAVPTLEDLVRQTLAAGPYIPAGEVETSPQGDE